MHCSRQAALRVREAETPINAGARDATAKPNPTCAGGCTAQLVANPDPDPDPDPESNQAETREDEDQDRNRNKDRWIRCGFGPRNEIDIEIDIARATASAHTTGVESRAVADAGAGSARYVTSRSLPPSREERLRAKETQAQNQTEMEREGTRSGREQRPRALVRSGVGAPRESRPHSESLETTRALLESKSDSGSEDKDEYSHFHLHVRVVGAAARRAEGEARRLQPVVHRVHVLPVFVFALLLRLILLLEVVPSADNMHPVVPIHIHPQLIFLLLALLLIIALLLVELVPVLSPQQRRGRKRQLQILLRHNPHEPPKPRHHRAPPPPPRPSPLSLPVRAEERVLRDVVALKPVQEGEQHAVGRVREYVRAVHRGELGGGYRVPGLALVIGFIGGGACAQ
ncbi:hypothetical protein B0H14DRAFT_3163052 [Mycena olivaceomarginata]|nr:hypothetical protein B0H14DRAFT_3163052 [Mycena olivaceomarginata]